MRYLIAVLMMGLLAACTMGASTPTEQPLPSIEMSVEESAEESIAASPDETTAAAMTCEEAWAEIALTEVSSVEELETIAEDLDATIENCESLEEWLDQASVLLPMVDTAEVEAWAAERCEENDTLSDSAICTEIDG